MTKSIEVTLLHATWCGHCVNFKPHWDKFILYLKKTEGMIGDKKIIVAEYESEKLKNPEYNSVKLINGKEFRGYPTIKITVKEGGKILKEYEYSENRTENDLIKHIQGLN